MSKDKKNNACEDCSWCCEHSIVPLLNDQRIVHFHENWGNKIFIDKNGQIWSVMYNPCQHLGEDGFCDMYDDPNKPLPCGNFPTGWDDVYAPHCKMMREEFKQEEK
jgi:hypothetical protein